MKNIKKSLGDLYKNMLFGINQCYHASKKYFMMKCLILISTTFMPLLTIWIWKEILNEVVSKNISEKKNYHFAFCIFVFETAGILMRKNSFIYKFTV